MQVCRILSATWCAIGTIYENMTSSTKPEEHNIPQHRRKRTKPGPWETWKFLVRPCGFRVTRADGQTDRDTDRQTDILITIPRICVLLADRISNATTILVLKRGKMMLAYKYSYDSWLSSAVVYAKSSKQSVGCVMGYQSAGREGGFGLALLVWYACNDAYTPSVIELS